MKNKLGRNDPCHCGSGKKYKHCHLRQEEEAARQKTTPTFAADAESVVPAIDMPVPIEEGPLTDALEEESGWWADFDHATVDGKIDLFLRLLDEGKLGEEYPFEMLGEIRDALRPNRHPENRSRYAELVRQLREEAPELYQEHAAYYHSGLIRDAIADERWDDLPELFTPFAENPDSGIDLFFDLLEALMYHGKSQMVIDLMHAGRSRVAESDELMPWVIDEFDSALVNLILLDYAENTQSPRFDDPALQEKLAGFEQLDLDVVRKAFDCLTSTAPAHLRPEDFGEAVDAEQWETNLGNLLSDFIVDSRQSGIPLSRSEMARRTLFTLLKEQLAAQSYITPPRATRRGSSRSGRRRGRERGRTPRATSLSSSLIPTRNTLNRELGRLLQFMSSHPYQVGAVVQLLPAYLHFLARQGLIHPTEMDKALERLKPLMDQSTSILDSYACDSHMIEEVQHAWSTQMIEALKGDAALAGARAEPPGETDRQLPVRHEERLPGTIPTRTFLVTYERDAEVWRKIELSEGQTLDDLHSAIQDAVDFDDDHPYSFFMSGRAWDKRTEYTSPHAPGQSAARIRIGDLPLRMKQTFLYLFDYGDEHRFTVQLIDVNPHAPKNAQYPSVVETHGDAPAQYGSWEEEDWDEAEDWDDEEDWEEDDAWDEDEVWEEEE